jgi:hypothetical protein
MTLEQQLRVLVEDAATHGIAPVVMEKAIAPIFSSLAVQLQHLEYYVVQNMQEDWLISVIGHRTSQKSEKKVIYAFATVQDAKSFPKNEGLSSGFNAEAYTPRQASDLIAIPIPVIQILFRVFSLQQIDSIIFFNQPGNVTKGIEIKRHDLQSAIQQQLLRLKTTPPDIA